MALPFDVRASFVFEGYYPQDDFDRAFPMLTLKEFLKVPFILTEVVDPWESETDWKVVSRPCKRKFGKGKSRKANKKSKN